MGALIPTLSATSLQTALSVGAGLAGSELSRKQSEKAQKQSLQQLQAQQKLQEQQLAQDAALERAKIATDTRQDAQQRQDALRRAVARQRAAFGSQGVGSGAGSSQAVLLGLFEETDDDKRRREELDQLRFNSIDQNLAQRGALNVLQRTQLAERNALNKSANDQDLGFDIFRGGVTIFNDGKTARDKTLG